MPAPSPTFSQRGLVKRERDEKDRRYFNVILTKKGKKLIRKIFPGHANGIVSAMENLTKSEQKQLGILCKKTGWKSIKRHRIRLTQLCKYVL